MRLGEGGAQLPREARRLRRGEPAVVDDALLERRPLDVLEDEEEPHPGVLAHVVEHDQVGVRHARRGPRLVAHAGDQAQAHVPRDLEVAPQVLHRHVAVEHGIVGEEHAAHGALAEEPHHLVPAHGHGQRRIVRLRRVGLGHGALRF